MQDQYTPKYHNLTLDNSKRKIEKVFLIPKDAMKSTNVF